MRSETFFSSCFRITSKKLKKKKKNYKSNPITDTFQDNLEAARKIEGDASAKFGGRFNAIVSDAEFAYVNWYGKRNCQLRYENRHSLTWED